MAVLNGQSCPLINSTMLWLSLKTGGRMKRDYRYILFGLNNILFKNLKHDNYI